MKKKMTHLTTVTKCILRLMILVMLTGVMVVTSGCGRSDDDDKIYEGVYVAGVDLGGMTRGEAEAALFQKFDNFEYNPVLKCEDVRIDIYSSRIELKPDVEKIVEKALGYGKDASVFKKSKIKKELKKNPVNIECIFTCNFDMLSYELNEKLSDYVVDVVQHSVQIGDNYLEITNGKPGRGVDATEVLALFAKAYSSGNVDDAIEVEITDLYPDEINADDFCSEYNREPKDAECVKDGDNMNITPEVIGVKIDEKEAKKILEQNKDSKTPYRIPAVVTYPKVTAAELEAEFTDTVLASYSTDYSTSSANRKENIRLASSSINGKILNPGEVFSFNDVVGPRTESTGYKVAHVYSGSKVVDGIGGGICQVSSTLYNAVVYADLEIVYRTNHSIPVSYVPLGRDATVSYGTIDFKFKNNKETPVKLEVIADGNNLTVNVYGRKKYKKDISIETAITGSIEYSTKTVKDDTMYEDERKIEEKGSNGTKTEAYKIVKENGVEVSRELLCKSSYSPITQVERVGTKKRADKAPEPSEVPENVPEQTPPAVTEPVQTPVPEPAPSPSTEPPAQTPSVEVAPEGGDYNEFIPVEENNVQVGDVIG